MPLLHSKLKAKNDTGKETKNPEEAIWTVFYKN